MVNPVVDQKMEAKPASTRSRMASSSVTRAVPPGAGIAAHQCAVWRYRGLGKEVIIEHRLFRAILPTLPPHDSAVAANTPGTPSALTALGKCSGNAVWRQHGQRW
jgi:hypothetical protein